MVPSIEKRAFVVKDEVNLSLIPAYPGLDQLESIPPPTSQTSTEPRNRNQVQSSTFYCPANDTKATRRTKPTMNLIPAFILSFCRFASSPASLVEAFQLSWTRTTTALSLRRPHRIDPSPSPKLMSQSPAKTSQTKTRNMKNSSLKANPSNDDASSSPSILDVLVTKIGSTTSMVVAGTFFVVLCYKRDALMVSFFLGSISNAIFGKVLKKILKIERPDVELSQDVP